MIPPDQADDPEYQKFVEEMAKVCKCTPLSDRPCDDKEMLEGLGKIFATCEPDKTTRHL